MFAILGRLAAFADVRAAYAAKWTRRHVATRPPTHVSNLPTFSMRPPAAKLFPFSKRLQDFLHNASFRPDTCRSAVLETARRSGDRRIFLACRQRRLIGGPIVRQKSACSTQLRVSQEIIRPCLADEHPSSALFLYTPCHFILLETPSAAFLRRKLPTRQGAAQSWMISERSHP